MAAISVQAPTKPAAQPAMPKLTRDEFQAHVALMRLDVETEDEAQQFVSDYQAALQKAKTRKRKRTAEQAKKHKNEQRARAKARDPEKYKAKKREQRERYRAKKKMEAEEAKQAHWRSLAELLELTEQ